jgi:hypothetical protein
VFKQQSFFVVLFTNVSVAEGKTLENQDMTFQERNIFILFVFVATKTKSLS